MYSFRVLGDPNDEINQKKKKKKSATIQIVDIIPQSLNLGLLLTKSW